MSDLDAATIKELAARLDKVAGRSIDPEGLGEDLKRCAARYLFARDCEGRHAPMSKSRDLLGKVLRRTKSLRAALKELTEIEHRQATFIMGEAYRGLPEIDEELVERQKMREPDDLGESDPVTPYDVAADDVLRLLRGLEKMERRLDAAFKRVDQATRGRRRPPESCLSVLVGDLASVYERHTGHAAGTSYDYSRRTRSGPFVRFVEAFLKHLEPDTERRAVGQTVRDILVERRHE